MRLAVLALACAAACARHAAPVVPVPPAADDRVRVAARLADPVRDVQPVAVAVTNGRRETLHLDPRQLFAVTPAGDRIAPLPPGEAARRAGGERLPGAVRAGARGAVGGSLLGALGGAISGAIQGGISAAVAAGAAVGAALGAITGVIGGAHGGAPDVAGFSERALPGGPLPSGTSVTGFAYYPAGTYDSLELVLPGDATPTVERILLEPDA
jgi:hypothetical protein